MRMHYRSTVVGRIGLIYSLLPTVGQSDETRLAKYRRKVFCLMGEVRQEKRLAQP